MKTFGLRQYIREVPYEQWAMRAMVERENTEKLASTLKGIKETKMCSVEQAETLNTLLHKTGALPMEVSLRFKSLYGTFDFVYSDWMKRLVTGEGEPGESEGTEELPYGAFGDTVAGLWDKMEPLDFEAWEIPYAAARVKSIYEAEAKLIASMGRDWSEQMAEMTMAEIIGQLHTLKVSGAVAAWIVTRKLRRTGQLPSGTRVVCMEHREDVPVWALAYCVIKDDNIPCFMWDLEQLEYTEYEPCGGYFRSQAVTPQFLLRETEYAASLVQ